MVRSARLVTVMEALAVPPVVSTKVPVPSSKVAVMLPLVLFFVPVVVAVTFTTTVQLELGARTNAVALMPLLPGFAVTAAPLLLTQVPLTALGEAITSPAGRKSLKSTFTRLTVVFGLLAVKVSEVVLPSVMLAAPKALVNAGGWTTSTLAVLLAVPGPLSVAETGPVVLVFNPIVVAFRFTIRVQVVSIASVPFARVIEPEPGTAVTVPPQSLLTPLGLATTRPAGRLSVNATPVSGMGFTVGLVMLKKTATVPFRATLSAEKNLVMVGGVATVKLAVAVLPVPPLVEVTLPVTLVNWPACVPVTVTLNWHWLLILIVAPDSAMPVGAVVVSVPPHTVAEALATVSPVGSVSVNATPVSATVFAAGLVMVKVNEVVPFNGMPAGLNTLAMEGDATTASTAVLLVAPVPPSVEVITPVVLLWLPAVVPVTSTKKLQVDPAAGDAVNVPPDRLMLPLPATAVIVPLPQEPVTLGVAATTTPAGRLSVKATALSALAVFGLVTVKASEVVPFNGT